MSSLIKNSWIVYSYLFCLCFAAAVCIRINNQATYLRLQLQNYWACCVAFIVFKALSSFTYWNLSNLRKYFAHDLSSNTIYSYNSLKPNSNDSILKNFHGKFYFTFREFARNPLRGSPRRNIFHTSFWCLIWDLNWRLTSTKLHRLPRLAAFLHSGKEQQEKPN